MTKQDFPEALLKPPIARAAYSDRTAWIMAELSRIAYIRFEGNEDRLEQAIEALTALSDKAAIAKTLKAFLTENTQSSNKEMAKLSQEVNSLKYVISNTFNVGGTQAILVTGEADKIAVLAFRGTEKDFRDIKTDLDARFYTNSDGTKVHNGFRDAYALIKDQVTEAVNELKDYKLYITGHSLGGALALIATRDLNSDCISACYTFGSPRVGSVEFGEDIKPPIYRVVNAADAVPHVPPSYIIDAIHFVLRLLPESLILVKPAKVFIKGFLGYRHHGDMRFLTAGKADYSDLKLLSNPDLFDRLGRWIKRVITNKKASFTDHGIANYCNKLKAYAIKRIAL